MTYDDESVDYYDYQLEKAEGEDLDSRIAEHEQLQAEQAVESYVESQVEELQ